MKNHARGTAGFTLLEVMLAMVLLAIGALALAQGTTEARRHDRDREVRLLLHRLVRNEAERARMANPWTIPASTTRWYNSQGRPTAAPAAGATISPPFRLIITRSDACHGGTMIQDNAAQATPTGSCVATPGQRPLTAVVVSGWYRSSLTPMAALNAPQVRHTIRISPSDRHGGQWGAATP